MHSAWRTIVVVVGMMLVLGAGVRAAESRHSAGEKIVRARGEAAIEGDDLVAAEKAARHDAARKAIEQVIGVFISAKTRTEESELVEDIIRTKALGFAALKKQISKGKEEDIFQFTGEFAVSAVPLAEELKHSGLLREWRVMVIIPEWHIQQPVPDPAAETEFIRQFVAAGFKVVDQKQYAEIRKRDAERLRDHPEVAAEVARNMSADVVITGEAFSVGAGDVTGSGFQTCKARVEVKALLAETGEIIAADALHGSGADLAQATAGKKALQRTAEQLAPKFIRDVLLLPAADLGSTRKMQVAVAVFEGLTEADEFAEAVGKIKGVNKVHQESFTEGALVLDVDVDADAAARLARDLEKLEGAWGKVRVTSAGKTRIQAKIKR